MYYWLLKCLFWPTFSTKPDKKGMGYLGITINVVNQNVSDHIISNICSENKCWI